MEVHILCFSLIPSDPQGQRLPVSYISWFPQVSSTALNSKKGLSQYLLREQMLNNQIRPVLSPKMTVSWRQCQNLWLTALLGLLWGARNLPTAGQEEQQTVLLGHPAMIKQTAPLSRHSMHHPQGVFLSLWPHAKEWSQIYCFYFSPLKILSKHFYSALHSSIPNLLQLPPWLHNDKYVEAVFATETQPQAEHSQHNTIAWSILMSPKQLSCFELASFRGHSREVSEHSWVNMSFHIVRCHDSFTIRIITCSWSYFF